MATATLPSNTTTIIRLNTQKKRAAFVRREIRSQGLSINEVAEETGHCWTTVNNFAQDVTKSPRIDTIVNIFGVLGYDVVFTARKNSNGTVSM